MMRVQVRVLLAWNGPFNVPPATSLHGLAGIHQAWDGLHGYIGLPVDFDRCKD
jgi:hypothetical protein